MALARECWQYREVLGFLAWRDIAVRYRHVVLGMVWAVAQPFATMVILSLLFMRVRGVAPERLPYPVFVYSGMMLWTFVAAAVGAGAHSLVGNASLLTKVYFPRPVIPAACVLTAGFDSAFGFLPLVGLILLYSIPLDWKVGLIVVPFALAGFLALSVGSILAALSVRYRDFRYTVTFLVQIWMFASPVFYAPELVPSRWRWALALNPMTGILGTARALLARSAMPWSDLGCACLVTAFIGGIAVLVLQRLDEHLADLA